MERRRSLTPPGLGSRSRQQPPVGILKAPVEEAAPVEVGKQEDAGSPSSSSSTSSRRTALRHLAMLNQASSPEQKAQAFGLPAYLPNPFRELGEPVKAWELGSEDNVAGDMRQFILKQRRCDYFNTQSHLVSMIMKLSDALTNTQDKLERKTALASNLALLNRWLLERRAYMALNNEGPLSLLGIHIPILRKHDTRQQVLRVHGDMCRIFSSASRAPFMLVYETANLDEEANAEGAANGNDTVFLQRAVLDPLAKCMMTELGSQGSADVPPREAVRQMLTEQTAESWLRLKVEAPAPAPPGPTSLSPCARCPHSDKWTEIGIEDLGKASSTAAQPGTIGAPASPGGQQSIPPTCVHCPALKRNEQAVKARQMIWGDSWKEKAQRVRQASPYGRYRSWTLDAVVVKGADDLRQELLAAQVIKQFISIFAEARLPLWLKDIEVLVTSSNSGIIEYIYDSISVDSMKKNMPGKSVSEIFKVAFADKLFEAKQSFIESCAAYSLFVWFMQVKDRHNGNLMMDSSGHVIHIDFGFMLSNSPGGNMAFEQSPFKLTQEFLEIMDGECSDQYEYFRTLVIRGFLEARKHMERIILPVRMMLVGSKLPCFREGSEYVLQCLHDRFFVNLTEEACIEKIVDLIDSSVNNWRTIQYDNYQRIVNGIL